MSQASSSGIARSKEGVPQWDGSSQDFQEYEETCLLWEASTPYHKRYLNGAKLANELQGSARKLILGKPVGWLSHPEGVRILLDFLRTCLGVPQLAEISEYLNKYFRQSRRKSGENMADYVTRKCEVYLRARQVLQRVQPHHQGAGKNTTSEKSGGNQWGSWQPQSWWTTNWQDSGYGGDRGRRASWDSEASQASVENAEAADPQAAAPVGGDGDSTTTATSAADPGRHAWRPWHSYSWYSWTYEDDWYYMWNRNAWTPSENGDRQGPDLVELLPDYVQGWYLLHDANLDVSERNIIQTALRGDYSLQRVAQELRSQWPEAELRRRDHGNRQGGYFGVEDEEENPEDETYGNYDEAILVAEGMNGEGLQAMQEANREAYDA